MIEIINDSMLYLDEYIKPNTIDSVVTDPPYELNFMNKGWDNAGVSFNKDTWKKCYEVLKPGGYLLAFGGSRTFHRIACAIEDAGFEIRDCIMWIYGSGFPKSMDISKQIDKKGGNDYSKQFAKDLKQARESRNLTMKYCDDKYCNGSTNWSWYEGRKDGCRVPDYQTYLEIVKEFPELEKYRELIKEAEREVIGTKKNVGCFNNDNHYTVGGTKANDIDITAPSTNLAKQWSGWGTCLKPAFEPIIVARKPFKGSLVDNVLEYGVGGLNIDECRVETNEDIEKGRNGRNNKSIFQASKINENQREYQNNGRFPANVILTYDETDFEEVCGGFPDTKSRESLPNIEKSSTNSDIFNANRWIHKSGYHYGDEGSAARYFYCAKASKKDRDEGLDEFEEQRKLGYGYKNKIDPTSRTNEGMFKERETQRKNIHPTVKPTSLMQYLIRLVTPKGGTILDPFMGSGSTGKAVAYENKERNANYNFIGVELNEEYCDIAEARINYAIKE